MSNTPSEAILTAQNLLLEPGGIDTTDLQRALNTMYQYRLDDADL